MDATAQSVMILLNGEPREAPAGTTIAALLHELGLVGGPVAVEVNLELVPRSTHERHALIDGDRVEIVTLVGGG